MADSSDLIPPYSPFEDPASDKLLGMVIALAMEVWVLRDRIELMEPVLEEKLSVSDLTSSIDKSTHDSKSRKAREESLNKFLDRICSILDER
jgi:hypothetical protein|tara:strand:- start:1219 stop:1494 length:276 start_codon:yes stop_codon:yes gene_type:complete